MSLGQRYAFLLSAHHDVIVYGGFGPYVGSYPYKTGFCRPFSIIPKKKKTISLTPVITITMLVKYIERDKT